MQSFINWYASFDTLFLKPTHQLSYQFMRELRLEKAIHMSWSQCPLLPQLPAILSDLEKLILSEKWKQCFCLDTDAKLIEDRLNWLLILVETQKMYGRQYWEMNERRVQASVVHYFLMLKQFFFAVIPSKCQNICEALQKEELCLQISQIEKLINRFVKNLRAIHIFLHHNDFQQERLLVFQFFESVTNFWKRLPQLSKKELLDIPKIMMFISLNNCLESLKNEKESSSESNFRMKSRTTQKVKQKQLSPKNDNDKTSEIGNYKQYQIQQIVDQANKSLANSQIPLKSKMKIFKFKNQIFIEKMLSEQKRSKVGSNASQLLQKNDTLSIKKNQIGFQNIDRYRSVTIIPRNYQNQDSSSILTKERLTLEKLSPKDDRRDRKKTKSIQRTSLLLERVDDQQLQRRKVKKDHIKLNKNLNFRCISKLRNYLTGQSKGWATIREHLNQKIAKNKIKKLLSL